MSLVWQWAAEGPTINAVVKDPGDPAAPFQILSTALNALDIYTFLTDGTDIFLIETQDFS